MRYCSLAAKMLLLVFFSLSELFSQNTKDSKVMAVTFDDLPMPRGYKDNADLRQVTERLLSVFKHYSIPVVGFVNTAKLESHGKLDTERVNILGKWLAAGLELGNHTYSHPSYNQVPFSVFKPDLEKGEIPLKKMVEESGKTLRYFRHPCLHTGRTPEKRDSLLKLLKEKNYTIAPVTIDNGEWIFSLAYDIALEQSDSAMMIKIGRTYISYMMDKIRYFEGNSNFLFGRNISQILLVHANRMNSDYFSTLCDSIISHGYSFITLDAALKDSAYQSKDEFFGGGGISWLHRWAITAKADKKIFKDEPECPEFILKYAGVDSE